MPLKPHPTDPDKMVYVSRQYNLPDSELHMEASPKRKEWVGLTDAEWSDLYEAHHDKYNLPKQGSPDGMDYERAIEALLKEKNS